MPTQHRMKRTMRRWSALHRFIALPILSFLLSAVPTHAQYWTGYVPGSEKTTSQTICCACKGPQDTDSNSCLTINASKLADAGDCSTLPSQSGALKGWTCQSAPLGEPGSGKCRPVPQNGVCKGEPQDAFSAGSTGDAVAPKSDAAKKVDDNPIIPTLNVQIPGFAFTGGSVTDESSSLLAQYIAGAYRYLISISAVAATIAFSFGAFLYLLGGAMPSINSGKRIMQDAVIGMLLVLGATAILRTINPDTLTLAALHIKGIDPQFVGNYQTYAPMDGTGSINGVSGVPNISKDAIAQGLIDGAKLVPGADACLVLTICDHETGLRPIWNGIFSGTQKSAAIAFGPCGIMARNLNRNNPIVTSGKTYFPDIPDSMPAAADWLLTNPKGNGYVAAALLKSSINQMGQNELAGLAAYAAGSGSLKKWQKANNCVPNAGQTVKQGSSSLKTEACVPHVVAIPTVGDAPQGCPEDKYECGNAKADSTGTFVGQCSNGRKCFAMITDDFVNYIIKNYDRIARQYPNCAR
jgi:hypothetical protein